MKKTILVSFCIICICISIVFFVVNFVMFPKNYSKQVEKYAAEFGIESELVYAIIKAESGFDKNAQSKAGAKGLMQLLPSTAEWIATELGDELLENSLFEPEVNVRYGCFYLSYLSKKFGDWRAVICAYNAGESVVKTWLDEDGTLKKENIKYGETYKYLEKVERYCLWYKNQKSFG